MAAVKEAGLTQIDNLITTHWHGDHFGGMAELAGRIPIQKFIDHGPTFSPTQLLIPFCKQPIPSFTVRPSTCRKPGDKLSFMGLDCG